MNSAGMQFIAMERMPGRHLYQLWDEMNIDHKKAMVSQIARAELTFPVIGSLQEEFKFGPPLRMSNRVDSLDFVISSSGPFTSTFEYLDSFVEVTHHRADAGEDADSLLSDVRTIIREYCDRHADSSTIRPPFRLIHPDFDGQNMLFTDPKVTHEPPQLTGIIDWEHAQTGPLYFLYEYPIFIQDNDCEKAPTIRMQYSDLTLLENYLQNRL
jgi:hypothetical protein